MLSLPVNIWRIKEKQTFRERTSLKLDTHPSKVQAVVSLPGHVFNGRAMAKAALQSLWSSPLVFLTCHGGRSASVHHSHIQIPGGVCRTAEGHL